MTAFIITAGQLFVLAVLLLTGYFIKKKNYIKDDAISAFSFILMNLSVPAVILTSMQAEYTSESLKNILVCMLSTIVVMFLGYFIARLAQKGLDLEAKERKVFLAGSMLYNNMFIGLPIVRALLGDEAVFYLCLSNLVFNFVSFTFVLGIFKNSRLSVLPLLKTPTILACIFGLVIFMLRIRFPVLVLQTLNYFAGMMTPLAMLIMGALVSRASLKEIFAGRNVYILSFLRLFFIPLTAFFLLRPFVMSEIVLHTITISCAMPVATIVSVFAETYGDCGKQGAVYCIVSTMLSLVSLPLVSALISYL